MTLSEESAVPPATRFRYRVAAAADTCCFVIQTPVPAFDVVVRPHAAFKHRPRRRRPRAGVDPRRSDVIAQVSLCCCCCFTFQLLKRSGDGSMNYREVDLSSGRRLTRSHVLLTACAVSTEHCVCFVVHFVFCSISCAFFESWRRSRTTGTEITAAAVRL